MLHVEQGDPNKGLEYLARVRALAPNRKDLRLHYAMGCCGPVAREEGKAELQELSSSQEEFPGKADIAGSAGKTLARACALEATASRTWQPERPVAWVVAVLVVVLALFWQTTWSMVEVWSGSGTYSHGFLIIPAFLWLSWGRRLALARLPIVPSWIGLIALSAIGMVWLIGDLAAAATPRQFAVVAMVPVAVATIFGLGWVRALAFPLAFLFFAVPFGDSLVPTMIDWTADFTVAALRVSGVPVYREGNNFSIPSGDWSVVDACSGIRYVFACLTVTTLYAWAVYRSTARRLLFVAGALAIAIVANWIRAYADRDDRPPQRQPAGNRNRSLRLWRGVLRCDHERSCLLGASGGKKPREPSAERIQLHFRSDRPSALARQREFRRGVAAELAATVTSGLAVGFQGTGEGASRSDIGRRHQPRAGWVRVDDPVASWRPRLGIRHRSGCKPSRRTRRRLASFCTGVFDRPTQDSKLTASRIGLWHRTRGSTLEAGSARSRLRYAGVATSFQSNGHAGWQEARILCGIGTGSMGGSPRA